jgi:hypothetical protein
MCIFKLNTDILFATDLNGIAIINRNTGAHHFIMYPEAAVWSVFIENHNILKSNLMLQSILGKSEIDTKTYINECLQKWRTLDIIV